MKVIFGPRRVLRVAALAAVCPFAGSAQEDQGTANRPTAPVTLPEVVVRDKSENLLGVAPSASKGQASGDELLDRPWARRGELLETVPGMIVTQHAGDGKANQYFLRGFNLDHGTDFGVFLDGVPLNQRTHSHGQGYIDANVLIPELLAGVEYFKGPYLAELGDFTSAGAANFRYHDVLPESLALFTFGENQYFRGLVAHTFNAGPGFLTAALEGTGNDGPWELSQDAQAFNGFLRFARREAERSWSLTYTGYAADWTSSDQIPLRAVEDGRLGRFGHVDPTNGGDSSRHFLHFLWDQEDNSGKWEAVAYAGRYSLDLYSNFTYFLDDPINGDQFNQREERWTAGGSLRRTIKADWLDRPTTWLLGLETRHDWFDGLGLHRTRQRERLSTTREDDGMESSAGVFASAETQWNPWLRTVAGLRADGYYFSMDSDRSANSGSDWAGILNPKVGLILGPWNDTEIYLNAGTGFHSNDARGVNTTVDAVSGDPVDPVDPLVRTYGTELGVRSQLTPAITTTLVAFFLRSDSELLYVGDAGTNEPGPGSDRYGVEWAVYWRPVDWFAFDSEIAVTEASLRGELLDAIPNSVPFMGSGGLTIGRDEGPYAGVRARFFAPRPLDEAGNVESLDSFLVNARIGWRRQNWDVALECLNLFDSEDNDIEYLYESRLRGESGPSSDRHFHPSEPRTFRVTVTYRF